MAKVLYTAEANVTGARANGHGVSSDGELEIELRLPTEMGGEGGGTNPEQLFAVELVRAAHEVCPYSNATRGNVDVTLTATGRRFKWGCSRRKS